MEGREEVTMDDETQIKWAVGRSQNARRTGLNGRTASVCERPESLHATLIAGTVATAVRGSDPGLGGTRHARVAL